MGIVRNFIDVVGIIPENELPREKDGQIIVFSETENIFIPEDREGIDTIYQIMIDLEIKSERKLAVSSGKILVLDGMKKFKVIYAGNENGGQINIINLNLPFNTFLDLPEDTDNAAVKVFILDAYFEAVDKRRIYGHFIYMLQLRSAEVFVQNKNNAAVSTPVLDIYKPNEAGKNEGLDVKMHIIDEVSISNEYKKSEVIELPDNKGSFGVIDDNNTFDIDSEYL